MRHYLFLCLPFLSVLLTGCPEQTQVDWVQRADLLDQYVISAEVEGTGSSVIPAGLNDAQVADRIGAFEDLLDTAIDRAYEADESTAASLLRLAGIDLGVSLRRLYGNRPLQTEILSLQGRDGCATDLVLDRHLARYTRALAAKDAAERLLILGEWQNGLNCLSARQAAALAEGLGSSLMALEARLIRRFGEGDRVDRVLAAFLEPVMLVVDATKGLAASAAHFWAHSHADDLGALLDQVVHPVHLYDFVSGNLAEIADAALLGQHLGDLLDRGNIGLGTCGFVEMLGSGLGTGRFDCGRGLECGGGGLDIGTPIGTDLGPNLDSRGDLADFLSRPNIADLDLTLFGADPDTSSALGVPMADLSDNCGGAGSGDEGAGDPSAAGGLTGFLGCMFQGAVAQAREGDVAYCTLQSMFGIAGRPAQTVVVGGVDPVTGAPIIKGVFGNEECGTDPLAGDGEEGSSPLKSLEEFKDSLRDANILTMGALAAGRVAGENEYLEGVATGMIDRWGSGDADGTTHTSTNEATLDRMKQWVSDDLGKSWPWEGGEQSVIKGRVAEAVANTTEGELPDDIVGTYNHSTGVITVDTSKTPAFVNVVLTILDEVAHAIERGVREGTGMTRFRPSETQLHKSNYTTLCALSPDDCQWLIDAVKAQIEETEEDDDSGTDTTTSDDDELPENPHGPDGGSIDSCTALGETLRSVMECHGFDEVAPGVHGPGDPPEPMTPEALRNALFDIEPEGGGDVDPSHEQWIASLGSGIFGQCMAQYGLGVVGMDENGVYVIGPAQDITADRCNQQINCPPPGVEMQIGAACRCSAPTGVILRDLGAQRLCQTSDACFPDPRLLNVRDVRARLEQPVRE